MRVARSARSTTTGHCPVLGNARAAGHSRPPQTVTADGSHNPGAPSAWCPCTHPHTHKRTSSAQRTCRAPLRHLQPRRASDLSCVSPLASVALESKLRDDQQAALTPNSTTSSFGPRRLRPHLPHTLSPVLHPSATIHSRSCSLSHQVSSCLLVTTDGRAARDWLAINDRLTLECRGSPIGCGAAAGWGWGGGTRTAAGCWPQQRVTHAMCLAWAGSTPSYWMACHGQLVPNPAISTATPSVNTKVNTTPHPVLHSNTH